MMSLSKLARRSLSRDLETSVLVIVFLRMSGSVNGAVWPFLRNRSIPQRSLWVEGCRIINGLAEERALVTALGGWCVQARLSSVCVIVVSGFLYVSCDAV